METMTNGSTWDAQMRLLMRAENAEKALKEAMDIIRKGQAAASASYHQAYAEWRGHDREQDKHAEIVADFRNAARRFLGVWSEPS